MPVVDDAGSVAAALAGGATWLWWQDHPGRTTAAADALEQLQAAAEVSRGGRLPRLVAGRAHDPVGLPLGPAPRPAFDALPDLLDGAQRRLLPITAAPGFSFLARREAFELLGVPDPALGPFASWAWSARALAGEVGWLAAASAVVVEAPPVSHGRREAVRAAARMARTGAWSRGQSARALADVARGRPPR